MTVVSVIIFPSSPADRLSAIIQRCLHSFTLETDGTTAYFHKAVKTCWKKATMFNVKKYIKKCSA